MKLPVKVTTDRYEIEVDVVGDLVSIYASNPRDSEHDGSAVLLTPEAAMQTVRAIVTAAAAMPEIVAVGGTASGLGLWLDPLTTRLISDVALAGSGWRCFGIEIMRQPAVIARAIVHPADTGQTPA